jgi:hypothetical protein
MARLGRGRRHSMPQTGSSGRGRWPRSASEMNGNAQVAVTFCPPAAMAALETWLGDKGLIVLLLRHVETQSDHVAEVLVVPFGAAAPWRWTVLFCHGAVSLLKNVLPTLLCKITQPRPPGSHLLSVFFASGSVRNMADVPTCTTFALREAPVCGKVVRPATTACMERLS